jgi:hypothetical protein
MGLPEPSRKTIKRLDRAACAFIRTAPLGEPWAIASGQAAAAWRRARASEARSSGFRTSISSVARLNTAFCQVGVAIDHLDVWEAPIIEQLRPR